MDNKNLYCCHLKAVLKVSTTKALSNGKANRLGSEDNKAEESPSKSYAYIEMGTEVEQ